MRIPTPEHLQRKVFRFLVWLALAMMLFSRIATNIVDLDIFHEMALIRRSIELGHLLTTDAFSYGPTLPYCLHHEWGAGLVAYFVSARFGAPGILALKYLLAIVLAVFCLLVAGFRNTDPLPALAVVAPVGILFAGAAFSPIRANLYSVVFVAALLFSLELDRRGNRYWIWFWLPVSLIWHNLHGGFVAGIILISIHCFELIIRSERWFHLSLVASAMALLAIVNPYGTHYYWYLWQALRMPRPRIAEWMPLLPSFPSFDSVTFLLSLVLLLYVLLKSGPRAMPGLAILCATGAQGALHQRMLPFYAVAWTCYVPGFVMATPLGARLRILFRKPPLIFQAGSLAAALFFLNVAITYHPWILRVPGEGAANEVVYPNGAVDFLKAQHFTGNLMAPFEYGAFVSWKMYPGVLVSIDSRYEAAYPHWWTEEVFRFYEAASGWQQTLTAYPTDAVLVRRTQQLAHAIRETSWRRIYIDGSFEIYERPGLELTAVDYHDRTFPGHFP